MPLFEIAIVYRGQDNYMINAPNADEAGKMAEEKWRNSEKPDLLGNEWEEIVSISIYRGMTGDLAKTVR